MKKPITCRLLIAALLIAALPSMAAADTVTVVQGEIKKTVFGSGEIQPTSQPGAYAEISAKVDEIFVGVGDAVEAGDILMQLDNDDLAAQTEQLEYDLQIAQREILYTKDHTQYIYRPVRDRDGNIRRDVNTGEVLLAKYSNEISIRSPGDGRIMAVYIQPGDDALAKYREHGSVVMLSTDGRMKVELTGVEGISLSYDQVLTVKGEGFETQGNIISLTRRGMDVTVQVNSDDYPMDAPVTVTTLEGEWIGEGILEINKPLAVSAYGGTIKGLYWNIKVGSYLKRDDVIARIDWDEIPLYIENDVVLREYSKILVELEKAREKEEALAVAAPCSGVVASVDVSKGDSVEDGTLLLSVVDGSAGMQLTLSIDELDIVHVRPGQAVTIAVDALPDVTLTGEVLKIAPLGNTETSVTTYDVYITLTGDIDPRIRGGMNVTGEIVIDAAEDALLIPTDALVRGEEGWQVQLANGEYVDVEIGVMTDSKTQILSGLYQGETVVY